MPSGGNIIIASSEHLPGYSNVRGYPQMDWPQMLGINTPRAGFDTQTTCKYARNPSYNWIDFRLRKSILLPHLRR